MSQLNVNQIVDASGGVLAPISSVMRNRIINGSQTIDQRNAGAAVTVDGSFPYITDRWQVQDFTDGVISAQQISDAPSGFVNSLRVTVTTADASLGSNQLSRVQQPIEGYNIADLGWGTASAKTITLSFWVKSSVTGTFGGSLINSGNTRSYPFTYTISAANTWEQKSVTITGDTTGTWLTTNGIGVQVNFSLAAGSSFLGTAGAWAGSDFRGATGQTNLLATLSATWQVTGCQFEVGTQATSFEYRQYGQELALCQRYAIRYAGEQVYELIGIIFTESSTSTILIMPLPVFMRATPSVSFSTLRIVENQGASAAVTAVNTKGSEGGNKVAFLNPTVASGLTASRSGWISANNSTSAFLLLSAEL
jgi:hypothetical protein